MEERKKNLCAMIPESLHKKVREEQEEWGIKLNEYMERILKDHFEKGEREMANGTRTLAFQVSEEFFQRLKKYLKKTGQSQKEFVIGLIEDVLSQEEHVVSGEMQETEGKAELEETEWGEGSNIPPAELHHAGGYYLEVIGCIFIRTI